MFKKMWYWALATLVVLGIGSFMLLKFKAPSESDKTDSAYKIETQAAEKGQRDTMKTPRPSIAQAQKQSETDPTPPVTKEVAKPLMDEPQTQDVLPEPNEGTEQTAASVEEPSQEKLLFGDYTKEELIEINEWGKTLQATLMEKYPEFEELTRMTQEEIAQKYSTDEDKQRLAQLVEEYFTTYLEESRAFLTVVPAPIRKLAIAKLHLQLAQNLGRQKADEIMATFADLVK